MSDLYDYWRAALRGAPEAELVPLRLPTIGANNGEDPQCGLWKVRLAKGAPQVPMQVWLADEDGKPAPRWSDNLVVAGQIAGKPADSQTIVDRWLYTEPATKEEAAHWRQHGRWPSDPPPLPARTHNLPADPFAALKIEVDDRIEQVRQWLTVHSPIGDQTTCDIATNMQRELLDLNKRADAMHKAEKTPVLEEERRIDNKFRFREALTDWAGRLRTVFGQFMDAEERRQNEERARKHREEVARVEAEQARIKAERAKQMEDDPIAAMTSPAPELPMPPPPPEPVKVQSGGGRGRKAGLQTVWTHEITDYQLAALHVIEQDDVRAAVDKVVARMVKAAKGKIDIPGVKVHSERKAA